jgi:hypothetical protein
VVAVVEARLAAAVEAHMAVVGRTVAQAGAARVRAIHRTSNCSPGRLPRFRARHLGPLSMANRFCPVMANRTAQPWRLELPSGGQHGRRTVPTDR